MVKLNRGGLRSAHPQKLDRVARQRRASADLPTGIQRFDTWKGWQDITVRAFGTTVFNPGTGRRDHVKRYRLVADGWHGARRYRDPNYAANDARLCALAYPSLWRYAPAARVAQFEGEGH